MSVVHQLIKEIKWHINPPEDQTKLYAIKIYVKYKDTNIFKVIRR